MLRRLLSRKHRLRFDFAEDGLGVKKRNLSFLTDPKFVSAWEASRTANADGWRSGVPDVRWRVLTCLSAAQQALLVDGDFVECGVHTGILSAAVCHYLDFGGLERRFFLFDTFAGVPCDGLTGDEEQSARRMNDKIYFDSYEIARRNFARFPNVTLVRGELPGTLDALSGRRVAYLSIDLNSATHEMQSIERLWPLLSHGAAVVIDDYGFAGNERQYEAWNAFARRVAHPIFYLPTGQGLMFRV